MAQQLPCDNLNSPEGNGIRVGRMRLPRKFWGMGAVVGVVHSRAGLSEAEGLPDGVLDAIEVRLDALAEGQWQEVVEEAVGFCERRGVGLLLTPRCASEGGVKSWEHEVRLGVIQRFGGMADAVDLELAAAERRPELVEAVRRSGAALLVSLHDFEGTPPLEELLGARRRALELGAAVFKVAARLRSAVEIARLAGLLEPPPTLPALPTAVTAMGPLGQAGRVFLAAAGSVLNYAWLGAPIAPGQLSAGECREVFAKLGIQQLPIG